MRARMRQDSAAWAEASVAQQYRVDDLLIDTRTRRVTRGSTDLAVGGLSYELLLVLVRAAPALVSVDALIEHVWQGAVVSPETVIQRVKLLRESLGERSDRPRYIGSLRGRGYRMVAVVTPAAVPQAPQVPSGSPPPPAAGDVDFAARDAMRWRSVRHWMAPALVLVGLIVLVGAAGTWWLFRHRAVPRAASGAVSRQTSEAPNASVAVLSFVNLTGDASKDYLGDGMAEELIDALTQVPGLKVSARTSSFAYKDRRIDIRQIASDLGVGTVLEGSVREAGKRIRITAQLVDGRSGLQFWSQSYDRQFNDLFELQDDLANAIVRTLKTNLRGIHPNPVEFSPPTRDVEAYDLYLQGNALVLRTSPQNLQRAIRYYEEALQRDPMFERALAAIANAHFLSAYVFGHRPGENLEAAEHAAQRARELDSTLPDALEVLAKVALARGQLREAEEFLRQALSLRPDDGVLHVTLGTVFGLSGRLRESLAEEDRAYQLAPVRTAVAINRAIALATLGRDADATRSAQLAEDLGSLGHRDPGSAFVYEEVAIHSQRYLEAAAAVNAELDHAEADQAREAKVLALVYGALSDPGRKAAAMAAYARMYSAARDARGQSAASNIAPCLHSSYAYVMLKEIDVAYRLANRCLDSKASGALIFGPDGHWLWTPELRPFRQDRRFQSFATRLGLMTYWQWSRPPDDCDLKAGSLVCR